VYREPYIEFLSTLTISYPTRERLHHQITYQLGGRAFSLSLVEFNVALGFETAESIQTLEYAQALHTASAPGFRPQEFWMTLTDRPPYSPRYSKATAFRDPVIHIFHRWVGSSILARRESTGSVSLTQLFILWAAHSQIRIDAGLFFADNYLQTAKKRPTSARGCCIAFGLYITSLCRYHEVLHPRASLLGTMDLIRITTLRNMGMIRGLSG